MPPDLLLLVLRGSGGVEDEAFVFEEVAKPARTEVDVEEATVDLFEPDEVPASNKIQPSYSL